jgi:hypothetical protein
LCPPKCALTSIFALRKKIFDDPPRIITLRERCPGKNFFIRHTKRKQAMQGYFSQVLRMIGNGAALCGY